MVLLGLREEEKGEDDKMVEIDTTMNDVKKAFARLRSLVNNSIIGQENVMVNSRWNPNSFSIYKKNKHFWEDKDEIYNLLVDIHYENGIRIYLWHSGARYMNELKIIAEEIEKDFPVFVPIKIACSTYCE